jgi:hypothetical protein
MKRLLFFVLAAAAAWYGWNHRTGLFAGSTDSEAVIVNSGTRAMLRVRLTVNGQTYVREVIEPDTEEKFPIAVTRESDFRLKWDWRGLEGAPEWRGGEVTPGPPRSRCTIQVYDDGGVTCACVPMPTAPGSN